jgi:ketosteroid isomerase-like protein
MSEESAEVVRQPIVVPDRSRRSLEDHLVRFPRVFEFMARAIWRLYLALPPRSRLRQAIIRRLVRRGYQAFNRGDLEAGFMRFDPDIELITSDPQILALGFDPVTRGLKARVEFQRQWNDEWGEFRIYPDEIIDLTDDRLLLVGGMEGSGLSSGAAVVNEWAVLYRLTAGRVVREQIFFDPGEALQAAGLGESGMESAKRLTKPS